MTIDCTRPVTSGDPFAAVVAAVAVAVKIGVVTAVVAVPLRRILRVHHFHRLEETATVRVA